MTNIVIDNPVTRQRETLTQSQFNSYMAQTNGDVLDWIVEPVAKHGTHDQKTHGSWATGVGSMDDIKPQLKELKTNYSKKYKELDEYLKSKGLTHAWKEVQADPIAKKLRAEADAFDNERRSLLENFYKTYFDENKGENFDVLRTKYVVADTPTLKMNKQLRQGGGVTQRVKDADALCAMGVVKEKVGVYRGAVLPKEMVASLKIGTSFVDKGFQSTDVSKSSAEFYAGVRQDDGAKGIKVLFRMTLDKGLNAIDVGYGEIAVQRNAKMTITNKSKSADFTIIDVEVSK
jgi:hypothetical protein